MTGIYELFNELAAAECDDYDFQFAAERTHERINVYRAEYRSDPVRRAKAVERTRQWRLANPERYRAARKLWRIKNPDKHRAQQRARRKRWQNKDVEAARAMWRKNAAAYRSRKRAAAGLPPARAYRRAA